MKDAGQPGTATLRRAIRLPHATALVAGIIIGASIFVQPSEVTSRVPSIRGVLLVWLVAGSLTLVGALITAEFAARLPRTGGVYVFLSEAFGPWLGFLWGWAMFWIMHSGIIAAIAVVFARYAGLLVPLSDTGSKAVAVGVILLLSAVNYVGVAQGSRVQTAFTVVKVGAIVGIIVLGAALGGRVPTHFAGSAHAAGSITTGDFFLALAAGLFAFGGWHMVTYSAEETIDPRKTIPRALILGVSLVTVCYIALNTIYLYVLPLDQVTSSQHVAADLAGTLLGPGAAKAIAIVVMFSSFGALAGVILTGPRVYLAMAQDGLLFRWLGGIQPTFRTPHRAIALQAVWASLLVATGSFRTLFTRVVYTEWVFFGLMAIGLLRVRGRTEGQPAARRTPALLITLFAAVSFAVVINQIAGNPRDTLMGLGFVLLGLPAYWIATRTISAKETS